MKLNEVLNKFNEEINQRLDKVQQEINRYTNAYENIKQDVDQLHYLALMSPTVKGFDYLIQFNGRYKFENNELIITPKTNTTPYVVSIEPFTKIVQQQMTLFGKPIKFVDIFKHGKSMLVRLTSNQFSNALINTINKSTQALSSDCNNVFKELIKAYNEVNIDNKQYYISYRMDDDTKLISLCLVSKNMLDEYMFTFNKNTSIATKLTTINQSTIDKVKKNKHYKKIDLTSFHKILSMLRDLEVVYKASIERIIKTEEL